MARPKSGNFERKTADNIIRNSQYIDKQPRSKVRDDSPPIDWGGGTVLRLTTNLTGASGSTAGIGMGIIQKFVGGDYVNINSTAYPVKNIHTSEINSGALVLCLPAYGYFHFITTSCSNVTT
jgi:hypothetical protein